MEKKIMPQSQLIAIIVKKAQQLMIFDHPHFFTVLTSVSRNGPTFYPSTPLLARP